MLAGCSPLPSSLVAPTLVSDFATFTEDRESGATKSPATWNARKGVKTTSGT